MGPVPELTESGYACEIIAASMTPIRPREQRMYDRRDAIMLARLIGCWQTRGNPRPLNLLTNGTATSCGVVIPSSMSSYALSTTS